MVNFLVGHYKELKDQVLTVSNQTYRTQSGSCKVKKICTTITQINHMG